jgi:hypothetical protein
MLSLAASVDSLSDRDAPVTWTLTDILQMWWLNETVWLEWIQRAVKHFSRIKHFSHMVIINNRQINEENKRLFCIEILDGLFLYLQYSKSNIKALSPIVAEQHLTSTEFISTVTNCSLYLHSVFACLFIVVQGMDPRTLYMLWIQALYHLNYTPALPPFRNNPFWGRVSLPLPRLTLNSYSSCLCLPRREDYRFVIVRS